MSSAAVPDLTLRQVYKNTLQTAIDLIEDTSNTISNKPYMTPKEFRTKLMDAFFQPNRRFYVGIWFMVLAFFLYFIDSAA
jgi:hypothetical protein